MTDYALTFVLERATTFARGDGIAGMLDREVAYDESGLPFLHGRTLKGLLAEEADNILHSLESHVPDRSAWQAAREALFGRPGSRRDGQGVLHVGPARLPENIRLTVQYSLADPDRGLQPADVLNALTGVRRQTAVDPSGLPRDNALRAMRTVTRRTPFVAEVFSVRDLEPIEEMLLAAAVLAFRRGGTGRNRGRGEFTANLLRDGKSILFERFEEFVREAGL